MANVPYPEDFPNVLVNTTINKMKLHPSYIAAKNGDISAALTLVKELTNLDKIKKMAVDYPNSILVPVHELILESGRFNAIPLAYANYISHVTGLPVCNDIIQITKASHTNKDALYRLLNRSKFSGPVEANKNYIIIDDVITQGGTVSELRSYIENSGGKVVCVSTLSFSRFSNVLGIKKETISEIERKFGRDETEKFIKEYGIGEKLEHLTNAEGKYILSYASLDRIRDRISEIRNSKEGSRDQGVIKEDEAGFKITLIQDTINVSDMMFVKLSNALMNLRYKKNLILSRLRDFNDIRETFKEKEALLKELSNNKIKKSQRNELFNQLRKLDIRLTSAGFSDYNIFLAQTRLFFDTYENTLNKIDKAIEKIENRINHLLDTRKNLIDEKKLLVPEKIPEKYFAIER